MSHICAQTIVKSFPAFLNDCLEVSVEREQTSEPDRNPEYIEDCDLDEEAFVAIVTRILACVLTFLELQLAEQLLVGDEQESVQSIAEDRRDKDEPLQVRDEPHNKRLLRLGHVEVVEV